MIKKNTKHLLEEFKALDEPILAIVFLGLHYK